MEWTGLNELREKFLSFYESKGHLRLDSFPLIPQNDNSLLLINSGMAPMKKFFLGLEEPPRHRVTTCQKCIRTPDIENVGKTARHGTFFEMLGNFSFGDYFKHEATAWAWEFCTKVMEMDPQRLWITIYQDDDEAFDIWTKEVGVDPSHIVRMGKEDNFWEIGSGPCGPCSEIYYDRGEKYGCGSPDCGVGCECDRFVEFWNLVFSQYDSDGEGHYTPMVHKNIDTGMGLERLACISQGVDNLFEVDTVQNIMKHIASIAGVSYGQDAQKDISLRVVTDHIRSTVFMIADGVMPSNEGRGYVLRRLLRRAARHGKLLGIDHTFLYQVVDTVVHENETAYPYLLERQSFIKAVVKQEEENFNKTLDKGLELLNAMVEKLPQGEKYLPAEDAFKLYDTYGFPLDLVKEILEPRGLAVEDEKFNQLMDQQRQAARGARENIDIIAWDDSLVQSLKIDATDFVGYTNLDCQAKVVSIVAKDTVVQQCNAGDEVMVVLDTTSFYAESGGQVADLGTITGDNGLVVAVQGCKKAPAGYYIHQCVVQSGTLTTGQQVQCHVDPANRAATARNHTCAHLLQAALRQVLGDHVHQAGQLVNSQHVRFDFAHFSALSQQELHQVEEIVNQKIMQAIPVAVNEYPIEEAKKLGAMALFGEKYGQVVRVVAIDDFSKEFCGGTHVANTGNIGLFKIISESSAAAGIRRIEAVSGQNALDYVYQLQGILAKTATTLKAAGTNDVPEKAEAVTKELKEAQKEIEKLNSKISSYQLSAADNSQTIGPVQCTFSVFENVDSKNLRLMGDQMRDKAPNMVAVLASVCQGKGTICVAVAKQAVQAGVNASALIKEIAKIAGGSGGGRPDSAMAGVKDLSKIQAAVEYTPQAVKQLLGL